MSQVQLFSHRTECPLLTTQSNKSNDNNNNSQRPKAKISKKWRKENSTSPRYISLSPVPPLSPPVLSPTFLKSPISFRSPISPISILKSTSNNYNTSSAEPLLPSTSALSIRRTTSNNHKTNSNSKLSRLSNHTGNKIHAFEEKQTEECLKQSSTCSSLPVITPPNSFAHYSI